MPVKPEDVLWAVEAFGLNVAEYKKFREYYNGVQDLGFATEKFNKTYGSLFRTLAYNRCRPVVDAQANRLKVTGFNVNGVDLAGLQIIDQGDQSPTEDSSPDATANDFGAQAMSLWRLTGMDRREGEIYVEQAISGDAYGVVFFDSPPPLGTGLPKLYPNRAELMRVKYDDEGRIILAAKSWLITQKGPDFNKRRLTFYTSTEITRLITTSTAEAELPKEMSQYTTVREVNLLGQPVLNPVPHNLGRVPVVHYPNNAPMLGDFGVSELKDVVPLQDALNKAVADMLVAMEYNAFPQRYATGIEDAEIDDQGKATLPWKQGPGEIWYSTGEQAKFGDFAIGDLKQFLSVQDQFDLDIARVSSTPVHWLIMTGTPPSGESIKVAESPFSSKLRDRQRSNGAGHAEATAMKFQLMGVSEPLLIETLWESAEPRSQREQAEIGKMMADAGMPLEIVGKAMGLDPQDMLVIEAAAQEERASAEKAMAQLSGNAMASQLQQDQESEGEV